MILKELVLQNIGPYQGRQVVNLSPETETGCHPIILFGGMNGGGKTTLLDAIRLALYGHRAQCSTRGNLSYNEFLTQSIHRYTTGASGVELAFQLTWDNEPVEVRICRTWDNQIKGGKDLVRVMRRHINSTEVWQDPALAETWDTHIEEIFPVGISNLFLFDGEQVRELAEQESPTQIVVDAIRSLLGLELASRLVIDLDVLLNRKRKELAKNEQLQEIQKTENELISKQDELRVAKQKLAHLENLKGRVNEELRLVEEKFISEGASLAANLTEIRNKINQIQKNIESEHNKLSNLAVGRLPLLLIQQLLQSALDQAVKEREVQEFKKGYNLLLDRRKKLFSFIESLAPDPLLLERVQSFWESEDETLLEKVKPVARWLDLDEDLLYELTQLLRDELPRLESLAQEHLETLQRLLSEKEVLEQVEATSAPSELYDQLLREREKKKIEDDKVRQEYAVAEEKCRCLEQEVVAIKKKLSKYMDEKIAQEENQNIISAISTAQRTLALFREKLTLRKLNQLESEVTECYLYLLHKPNLVHRVTIDTKTFALSLYDATGQLVPKHRLSAGEKQLLAIALLWGLARASGRILPVAIDTPLGRLDSSHRANLVERYFPAASQQVILLSTDTEITQTEVELLRRERKIAREYRLVYDPEMNRTTIQNGYFW